MRQPSDFKEVRQTIEKFHWLKNNIFGIEFNSLDAAELAKHIKVKYLPENSVVFLTGDMEKTAYFILRGKVAVGLD